MYLCNSENQEKYVYNIHLGLHAQNNLVGGKKNIVLDNFNIEQNLKSLKYHFVHVVRNIETQNIRLQYKILNHQINVPL